MTGRHAASSTQARYPWRATLRTVSAFVLGFALVWPTIVEAAGVDQTWAWVSVSIAVAGGITRVMANPRVTVFLERFLPFLAPEPPAKGETFADVPRLFRN